MDSSAAPSGGLSIYSLVAHADPVVQAIVVGLVLCSVACWAIIFEKLVRISALKRQIAGLDRFARDAKLSSEHLDRFGRLVLNAALNERPDIEAGKTATYEARLRYEEAMRLAFTSELRRAESGLTFLATVGSAAPFVGLFGTVWGIMASFTSIAQAQDTSLAVVAPGIAEALFATATGLAAAIPAVVAYNQIGNALARAAQRGGAAIRALARAIADEKAPSTPAAT